MADDDKLVQVMEKGFDTLADLVRETNDRLDTTRRELKEEIRGTHTRIDETNTRLDNILEVAGRETRRLRADVEALESRVEALEQKAS